MENSNVKENLEVLFEKFKNMIKVETVVGEAVQIGDTTLVPFCGRNIWFRHWHKPQYIWQES